MKAKLNEVINHIRVVCEDNANSPNPVMVIRFIESIIYSAKARSLLNARAKQGERRT